MESLRRKFPDGESLCRYMVETTGDTCLLAFSRGKDAIAAWIQLRRYFKRIIPFYLYQLPGLRFEEESLAYYERFFGTHIHRYPQPALYQMLDGYIFQSPDRLSYIDGLRICWDHSKDAPADDLRERYKIPGAYVATGVRAADSPIRGMSIRKHGSVNHNRMSFLPVYDWRMDRLVDEIKREGVKLPFDYRIWGRTYDGIDYRFIVRLRRWYPDDYQRLLTWFPLVELEILRRKAAGVDVDRDAEGQPC